MEQQIAEIDGVHRRQALLVLAVEVDRPAPGEVARIGALHLLGTEAAILPTLDHGEQQARRPASLVDILRLEDLLQQADLIVGIENRKARLQPDGFGVPAQDARGNRMERAEPYTLGGSADHRLEPLVHLARRLVGKGDGEKLGRKRAAGAEDVGEPGRQNAGLAGAGACEDQHRTLDRLDGAALRFVETVEIGDPWGRRPGEDGGIGHTAHDIARMPRRCILTHLARRGSPARNADRPGARLADVSGNFHRVRPCPPADPGRPAAPLLGARSPPQHLQPQRQRAPAGGRKTAKIAI